MNSTDFLNQLDESAIVAAIKAAERMTSGEIRVFISTNPVSDPLDRASFRFKKLGMDATRERNGVLLYFAPESQKFAVIGDVGIHAKCGQAFWEEVAANIKAHLRDSHFTDAVVQSVQKIGQLLAQHFPARPDDQNELPDRIERGLD